MEMDIKADPDGMDEGLGVSCADLSAPNATTIVVARALTLGTDVNAPQFQSAVQLSQLPTSYEVPMSQVEECQQHTQLTTLTPPSTIPKDP